ncbi:MAG: NFACT RNA binding domain-containing protein, partial [Anaerolineae bacterium]
LQGMSPLLAREICFRALGEARARVSQVERLSPLLEMTIEMLAPLEDGRWQPTVVLEEGQPVVYAPYPLTHRGEPQAVASMSRAIEDWVAATATIDPYAGAKRPVREAIAQARSRLTHRRRSLERSMKEAAEAEQWRQWGEWILAYAHEIAPRQEELAADTGEGVLVIPLDPDLSAVDNAQAYFARYRKAQRAAKEVPQRLRRVKLALRDLEQLETDLSLADSRPVIEEVRAALTEAGHLRSRKRHRSKGMAASEPLTLNSPDGLTILVGRNSRQNDEVTFRRAGSDDWWFHARGVPGAHVIVRSREDPLPDNTVQRAAELAAYFSQLQGEADVLVDYTRRRYVRRIAGAAPGLVTYSREQTARVPPRGPKPDEGE